MVSVYPDGVSDLFQDTDLLIKSANELFGRARIKQPFEGGREERIGELLSLREERLEEELICIRYGLIRSNAFGPG